MLHGDRRLAMLAPIALAIWSQSGLVHAFDVTPPPLPPGGDRVRVQIGMNPHERQRAARAHRRLELSPRRDDSKNAVAGGLSKSREVTQEDSDDEGSHDSSFVSSDAQ